MQLNDISDMNFLQSAIIEDRLYLEWHQNRTGEPRMIAIWSEFRVEPNTINIAILTGNMGDSHNRTATS